VITAIDHVEIAGDGSIELRAGERVDMRYLLSLKYPGEQVHLDLWREGKRVDVDIVVEECRPLVPSHLHDQTPRYVCFQGLVFSPLSVPYMHATFEDTVRHAPVEFLYLAAHGIREHDQHEIVVLSHVLDHPSNVGYDAARWEQSVLRSCNGTPIRHLDQLRDVLLEAERKEMEFVHFEFDPHGDCMVLHTSSVSSSSSTLETNTAIVDLGDKKSC
jgi:hypothetical protein